jgi:hypothetical protein
MPKLVDEFKKGDVLYGMHAERKKYWNVIESKGGYFITADRYNETILAPRLDWDGDLKLAPRDGKDLVKEKMDRLFRDPKAWGAADDKEMLAELKTVKEFAEFLWAHDKFTPTRIVNPNKDKSSPRIRRACKAMIQFITSRQGRRLHFLLDGLDMNQTVDPAKDKSFTGSELRYIYRNWNGIVDKQLGSNLQARTVFYLAGNSCQPPWDSDPKQWEKYRVHREQKKWDVDD